MTSAFSLTALAYVLLNGSLAQLWGTINGIQIGVYLSLTNVPTPENASYFNNFLAAVVTFDIPDVDMESTFGVIIPVLNMPEDDSLLIGDEDEELSDLTQVGGTAWKDIKLDYFYAPNFDRKRLFETLSQEDQSTLIRLAEAQEE